MTIRDPRSVGELLLESDLAARRLLVDAERLEISELAASWSSLLCAAEELVEVLPRRAGPLGQASPSMAPDPSLGRLRAVTGRLERLQAENLWLSSSPRSVEISAIAANFGRARELVAEYHRARSVPHADVLADGAAARARVTHTLYVTAHALALAARYAVLDRSAGARRRPDWKYRQLGSLRSIQKLAESMEQLAGEEVRHTYPTALQGEWREHPRPSRLRESLAVWEVEARRSMAGDPSLADRTEVVRVQGAILAMGRVLMAVAAQHGAVDRDEYRDAIAPRMLAAEMRVGEVCEMVQDLAARGAGCLDQRLARAGSEVLLAHTELVLDGTAVASPVAIARRTDLCATSSDVAGAIPAAIGVLTQLGTSLTDPELATHAVGLQQLINRLEGQQGVRHHSPETPWVDPRDLALGRAVAPPDWLRAELDGAFSAATSALSAVITAISQAGVSGPKPLGALTADRPQPSLRPRVGHLERGQDRSSRVR